MQHTITGTAAYPANPNVKCPSGRDARIKAISLFNNVCGVHAVRVRGDASTSWALAVEATAYAAQGIADSLGLDVHHAGDGRWVVITPRVVRVVGSWEDRA
jgi:hypothetical protein